MIWKRAPASATVSRIVTTKAVVAKMLQNTKRRASKKDVPTSAELANASVRFPKMVAIKAAARASLDLVSELEQTVVDGEGRGQDH